MKLDRPHFVVIGAMKCATSTLHDQLAAQPGFFMSTPKEPNFFSDDTQWQQGLDWYAGLFRAASAGDLCGESSTHYTKLPTHPRSIERMRAHLPDDARFVYLMRHPIDRLVAHYVHDWSERIISCSIEEAVSLHPNLVDYGCYAHQLEPYLETFGRERVLPVFLDHLKQQPQAALERVCRFLGHRGAAVWQEELGQRNVSAQRLRKSPWRDALLDAPLLRQIRTRWIPPAWRNRVKGFWQMRQRPQLGAALRQSLEARFDRDLARLGAWLGVPLDCQNFRERTAPAPLEWSSPDD